MPFFRYFQNPPFIGLDLGATTATFIQLHSKTHPWRIEKYAQIAMPAGWLNGRMQWTENLLAPLKECVERLNIQNAKTAVGLLHHYVISKRIKMPLEFNETMDETERVDCLKPYFTGMKEAFYVDYSVKENQDDMDPSMWLFATQQTVLDSIKQCIHAIGLRLTIVDVSTYAFSRGVMAWLKSLNVSFKRIAILCLSAVNQLIYIDYPEVVFVHDLMLDDNKEEAHQAMIHQMKAAFQVRLVEWEKIEALVVIHDNQTMKTYQPSLAIPCFSFDIATMTGLPTDAIASSILTSIGLALRGRRHD